MKITVALWVFCISLSPVCAVSEQERTIESVVSGRLAGTEVKEGLASEIVVYWKDVRRLVGERMSRDLFLDYAMIEMLMWGPFRETTPDFWRESMRAESSDFAVSKVAQAFVSYPGRDASDQLYRSLRVLYTEVDRLMRWHEAEQQDVLMTRSGQRFQVANLVRDSVPYADSQIAVSGYFDERFKGRLRTHYVHAMVVQWWQIQVFRTDAINKRKIFARCYSPLHYSIQSSWPVPGRNEIKRRAMALQERLAELPLAVDFADIGPVRLYSAVLGHLRAESLQDPTSFDRYESRMQEVIASVRHRDDEVIAEDVMRDQFKEDEEATPVIFIDGDALRDFRFADSLNDVISVPE